MQATLEIAQRISTISVSSTMKVAADADRLRREGVDVVDFGAGEPDFGTQYTVAECMVTVGGKHAIFNLIQALVDPGDEVVIPVPYWVTYKDVVNYAGGTCVFVDTDEANGFELTAAMLEPHLTSRT